MQIKKVVEVRNGINFKYQNSTVLNVLVVVVKVSCARNCNAAPVRNTRNKDSRKRARAADASRVSNEDECARTIVRYSLFVPSFLCCSPSLAPFLCLSLSFRLTGCARSLIHPFHQRQFSLAFSRDTGPIARTGISKR